jgi:hypothetical protein
MASTKASTTHWHHFLHPLTEASPHPSLAAVLHPTRVHLSNTAYGELVWTSRNHRKHRYQTHSPSGEDSPGKSRHRKSLVRKLWRLTHIEYWNVSWWVAMVSTVCTSRSCCFTPMTGVYSWKHHMGHQRIRCFSSFL